MKSQFGRLIGKPIASFTPISGTKTFQATTGAGGRFFCKTSPNVREEAEGLKALSATETIRCPKVIGVDEDCLALEWIENQDPSPKAWELLGKQLAALHAQPSEHYGFPADNHIGETVQLNPQYSISEISWGEYFIENRLKPMLHHGHLSNDALLQATYHKCEPVIQRHLKVVNEKPCLLHGDLWNGNVLFSADQPVLIDPAPYWGHRETDLAMTQLFGGFSEDFYSAYRETLPLQAGYETRREIYNLFHLLNHWIIFGESYRLRTMSAFKKIV